MGEVAANPGYMLVTCANACNNEGEEEEQRRTEGNFAVASITGKRSRSSTTTASGTSFELDRRTTPRKPSSALDACSASHEEEQSNEATVQCVSDELQQFFSPKRDELSIEKFLFDHALKIAPKAFPTLMRRGAAYSGTCPSSTGISSGRPRRRIYRPRARRC